MAEQRTVPWNKSQFYRVDGIPMVYERITIHGTPIDYIMDYEARAWTVDQLAANGHKVEKPGLPRLKC